MLEIKPYEVGKSKYISVRQLGGILDIPPSTCHIVFKDKQLEGTIKKIKRRAGKVTYMVELDYALNIIKDYNNLSYLEGNSVKEVLTKLAIKHIKKENTSICSSKEEELNTMKKMMKKIIEWQDRADRFNRPSKEIK